MGRFVVVMAVALLVEYNSLVACKFVDLQKKKKQTRIGFPQFNTSMLRIDLPPVLWGVFYFP